MKSFVKTFLKEPVGLIFCLYTRANVTSQDTEKYSHVTIGLLHPLDLLAYPNCLKLIPDTD